MNAAPVSARRTGDFIFSSESVTEGHPDKIADQVSDGVLDAVMKEDPAGRVAVETLVTTGMVVVAGEMTTACYVDIPELVRRLTIDIGYTDAKMGLDGASCAVLTTIDRQSPDIAMGVDRDGAGDQGMMFGYACDETEELMPYPIMAAHRICRRLAEVRRSGKLPFLRPDGKSQVSVRYAGGRPAHLDTVVVSTQHSEDAKQKQITEGVLAEIIKPSVPDGLLDKKTRLLVNPTGRFVLGGPHADTGLTGRKIIVDTYGGYARHGGGAFSGKDPTKVDRSAAYMARHIAKNVVAAGLASSCEVELAYAIGVADPVSLLVDCRGTEKADLERIAKGIREVFPLTPKGIIKYLELRRPIYRATAAYGHFGRTEDSFSWEKTSRADDLRKAVEK